MEFLLITSARPSPAFPFPHSIVHVCTDAAGEDLAQQPTGMRLRQALSVKKKLPRFPEEIQNVLL